MPIILVDPATLDKSYSWMGAVYVPAEGGTFPVPAELTAQIAKLQAYIDARTPKKPDDGGTTNGGTTDTRTAPDPPARTPPSTTIPQRNDGGTGPPPVVTIPPGNGGTGPSTVVVVPKGNGNGQVVAPVDPDPTPLPEGFPGKAEFEAEGHSTREAVQELADIGELQSVTGVGPKIEEQVTQYLAAFKGDTEA